MFNEFARHTSKVIHIERPGDSLSLDMSQRERHLSPWLTPDRRSAVKISNMAKRPIVPLRRALATPFGRLVIQAITLATLSTVL